jgi:hypothetical protein
MDVPAWARRAIIDAVGITYAELFDRWTAWVPPAVLTEFKKQVGASRVSLVERIIEIITTEDEGPGSIYVLQIDNSSAHDGLIKVTAIADGGEKHRFNRLRGDIPNCEIVVLHKRAFRLRLATEKIVLRHLRGFKQPTTSKWYDCSPSVAIEMIETVARSRR